MKFSFVAAATLAIAGLASAAPAHPAEFCSVKSVATEAVSCIDFAVSKGLSPSVFGILNHGLNVKDCAVVPGIEYCVSAPRTKAKRCLAEKKAAAEKAAAEKAAAEKAAAEKAAAEKKPAPSSSGAPSAYVVPRSETADLKLVNKINENCKWFYTITEEDSGCDFVAAKNNIPTAQLYSLNKNLHSKAPHTCDNLDTGKTYCISL